MKGRYFILILIGFIIIATISIASIYTFGEMPDHPSFKQALIISFSYVGLILGIIGFASAIAAIIVNAEEGNF